MFKSAKLHYGPNVNVLSCTSVSSNKATIVQLPVMCSPFIVIHDGSQT